MFNAVRNLLAFFIPRQFRSQAVFVMLFAGSLAAVMGMGDELPKNGGPGVRKGSFGKGKAADKNFVADRETFHFLLTHHKNIQRSVKKIANGVVTVTESENPEVAKKIQEHVHAMYKRLKSGDGLRYWDPLFAEVFKHGKKMKMEIINTEKGVQVTETSDDAEVVKIIQAHADVVTQFVEKGFDEAHKQHPLPSESGKK